MKEFKNNKGLLDRKRFAGITEEEAIYSRNLSIKQSIRIMEGLLDSGITDEIKKIRLKLDKTNGKGKKN